MSTQLDPISIIRPDDWHLHLRDSAALQSVVAATARQFGRAIVMPNLKPPITDASLAIAYRDRILDAVKRAHQAGALSAQQANFEPLMTLYLTDNTTRAMLQDAKACGVVHALKLYPAGATTNSDAGVTHIDKVAGALEAMQALDIPLLIHGESTDPSIDVFDREAVFIDKVLIPVRARFPALRIVFEHITTLQAAQYVASEQSNSKAAVMAATITPHHLLFNRNAMFAGGMRPHVYCLPILKREQHRLALLKAATSGSPSFFLGTDSAPHSKGAKEQDCGCAGCYVAPHALELYAAAFESVGALDKLESFASRFGPQFYKLPVNQGSITLQRRAWQVPKTLAFAVDDEIVPLCAGETLAWQML